VSAPNLPGEEPGERGVRIAQFAILGVFTAFALSVVLWVGHLISVSWKLDDTFSGSLAISIVAVPLFLTILTLVHYVFWGLYRNREEAPHAHGGAQPQGDGDEA